MTVEAWSGGEGEGGGGAGGVSWDRTRRKQRAASSCCRPHLLAARRLRKRFAWRRGGRRSFSLIVEGDGCSYTACEVQDGEGDGKGMVVEWRFVRFEDGAIGAVCLLPASYCLVLVLCEKSVVVSVVTQGRCCASGAAAWAAGAPLHHAANRRVGLGMARPHRDPSSGNACGWEGL